MIESGRLSRLGLALGALLAALGCQGENDEARSGHGGRGAAPSAGGSSAEGGADVPAEGSGERSTGGVSSGDTGGALATGAASGIGSAPTAGGDAGRGGAEATGAAPATGGEFATGGAAGRGGAETTGAAPGNGGTPATGGGGTGGLAPPAGGGGGAGGLAPPTGGEGGASLPVGGAGEGGALPAVGGTGGGSPEGGTATGGVECGVIAAPGEIITFTDDGSWSWFQDERVIVDPAANRLLFGSVAVNGDRIGNVEVTTYDLAGGAAPQRTVLGELNPDEYSAPALFQLGEGRYVAAYAGHDEDCSSYFNVYEDGSWGGPTTFDWTAQGCPFAIGTIPRKVAFANLWRVGDQIYDLVRAVGTTPSLLVSTDGASWDYAGRLTGTPTAGTLAGYYKFWGNGADRVDFVGTEAHPRDFDNSLYHGYVKDERIHDSTGAVVDAELLDGDAAEITAFTPVFATGSPLGDRSLRHLWPADLVRYPDGTIAVIFTGRAGGDADDPDLRFGYARFDGTSWRATYLTKAGRKLYDSEPDYTGLGALHPNDPTTLYLSTTTDPRDDTTQLGKHEIWRGTTCDGGVSFAWTPITEQSTQDNLRPVVPSWESDRTALLWMRGTYDSASTHSTDIVGVILDGR